MRKSLLLIASLFLVTAFGVARDDFYNRVVSNQVENYQVEMSGIGEEPTMLAGNNMITDGQRAVGGGFSLQAAQESRSDFYNAVLAAEVAELRAENEANWGEPTLLAGNNMVTTRQASRGRDFYNQVLSANVGEFQAENSSNWEGPTLLAGNNMVTDRQASRGRDFYNGVLSAQVHEFSAENGSIAEEPTLLAGNNMITGDRVVFAAEPEAAPEDFYNQVLTAKVDEYGIDNNAIAPSATVFAESQPASIVPGSIAGNVSGGSNGDWYSKTVAIQAELNRRIKKSVL